MQTCIFAGGFAFLNQPMEEIGRTLKERRERLGLTLEEVERSTRIRANRLEALEAGEFDSLPSEVQVRGFLRNYADFLGLMPEEILNKYESLSGDVKRKSRLTLRRSKADTEHYALERRSKGQSITELLISGVIVVAVAAVFIWGVGSIVASLNSPQPTALSQPLIAVGDTTETPTETSTPVPQLSLGGGAVTALAETGTTATPTLILPVLDSVRIELTAVSETWVRLSVDGEEVFQGRMAPGEQLNYTGQEKIELLTGNAGGLRVVFNGQDQGPLGDLAQVVERVWSPRGVVTPTATITPTITATPEQSVTPSPTSTVTSTAVIAQ
jgi:cytoskeleton protein RodZ